jgi:hypothetical protein
LSLAQQCWKPVSIHEIVAEFLLGERGRGFQADVMPRLTTDQIAAVERPNIADPLENHFRLRLLMYCRAELIGEIPPDTRWFEVSWLGNDDLRELKYISRCRLENMEQPLTEAPTEWRKPILWGHDEGGPFTIMEGNHRLSAAARTNQPFSIRALVGLSPTPCFFHGPDPGHRLVNDLWRDRSASQFKY